MPSGKDLLKRINRESNTKEQDTVSESVSTSDRLLSRAKTNQNEAGVTGSSLLDKYNADKQKNSMGVTVNESRKLQNLYNAYNTVKTAEDNINRKTLLGVPAVNTSQSNLESAAYSLAGNSSSNLMYNAARNSSSSSPMPNVTNSNIGNLNITNRNIKNGAQKILKNGLPSFDTVNRVVHPHNEGDVNMSMFRAQNDYNIARNIAQVKENQKTEKDKTRERAHNYLDLLNNKYPDAYEYLMSNEVKNSSFADGVHKATDWYSNYSDMLNNKYDSGFMGWQADMVEKAGELYNKASDNIQTETYKKLLELGMPDEDARYWDRNIAEIKGIIETEEAEKRKDEYMSQFSADQKNAIARYWVAKNASKYIQRTENIHPESAMIDVIESGIDPESDEFKLLYEYIGIDMNKRFAEGLESYISDSIDDNALSFLGWNAMDVFSSPFQGITGTVGGFIADKNKIDKTQPTDTNAAWFNGVNASNAIQKASNEKISEWANGDKTGEKVGQFAYSVGSSTAKSLWSMYLGGTVAEGVTTTLGLTGKSAGVATRVISQLVTLPSFGTTAYATTLENELERGMGKDQAQATAIVAGLNEMAFEELSLDKAYGAYSAAKMGKGGIKKLFMNAVSQAGIEGTEEVFTDLANDLADNFINQDFSDYNSRVESYIAQGFTEEEARKKVNSEKAIQYAESWLAGTISGGVTGAFQTYRGVQDYNSTASKIMENEQSVEKLQESMLKNAPKESDAYKIASSKDASELTRNDVANMLQSYEESTYDENTNTVGRDIGDVLVEALEASGVEHEQAVRDADKMLVMSNAEELGLTDEEYEANEQYAAENDAFTDVYADYLSGKLATPEQIANNARVEVAQERQTKREEVVNKVTEPLRNAVNSLTNKDAVGKANYNGSEVNILGLESVGKNPVVKTSAGNVKMSDLTLENSDIGRLIDGVASLDDVKTANNALKGYNKNLTPAQHLLITKIAYDLGQNGQPLSTLLNDKSFWVKTTLEEMQKTDKYNAYLTTIHNNGIQSQEQRNVEKVDKEDAKAEKPIDVAENDKLYDYKEALNASLGINVKTNYGTTGYNGSWLTRNATLTTNSSGNEYDAIIHEMYEFTRALAPESYDNLKQAVFSLITDVRGNAFVHDLVKQKQDIYRRAAKLDPKFANEANKTYSQAADEVLNDFMAGVFSTKDGITQMTEHIANSNAFSSSQKANIFQSISEWVSHLIDTISNFLKGNKHNINAQLAHELEKEKVNLNEIRDIALKALDDAKTELDRQLDASHTEDVQDDYGESQGEFLEAHSIDSLFESVNLMIMRDTNNLITAVDTRTGEKVNSVTDDMIKASPFGAILKESVARKTITQDDFDKQVDFMTRLVNQMLTMQDIDMVWALNSTIGLNAIPIGDRKESSLNRNNGKFAAYTSNSDPQYSTTIDFTTICIKTQAVIDAMSETMKRLKRGLTEDEIVKIVYDETHKAGEPVPCPVCYVFSRWVGLGGLFNNMWKWQNKYSNMSTEEIQKDVDRLNAEITKIKERTSKSNTESKDKLYKEIKAEYDKLDTLRRAGKEYDAEKLKQLEEDINTLNAWSWLKKVRLHKDYAKKGNVPSDILFDINKGREFADQYPLAWKFRTTRGPAMGKAAVPYNDMRTGQIIRGRALSNISTLGDMSKNPFLSESSISGELDAVAKRNFTAAINKAKAQNLLNGQRIQSTSDFRFEYALDYLMAFFELQAIGSKVQLYTKVPESVAMFATVNGEVNCSLMALANGFEECSKSDPNAIEYNGKYYRLTFSPVTGMDVRDAFNLSSRYDNVQPIIVGIGEQHIRMCMRDDRISFIIPYHSSGSSEKRYVAMMKSVEEAVADREDYSNYQGDKEMADATATQIAARELRTKILTGKATNLSASEKAILEGNKFLSDLYGKMYNAEDKVFLTSDQAKTMMPHEYWDYSTTIDNADINGQRFVDYCKSLGLHPRFSGYNSNGVYNEAFDFTNEKGYWKTLIDRRMYGNDGKYHEQKPINVTDFSMDFLQAKTSTEGIYSPSVANKQEKVNDIVDKSIARINNGEVESFSIDDDFFSAWLEADEVETASNEFAEKLNGAMDFETDITKGMAQNVAKRLKSTYKSQIKTDVLADSIYSIFRQIREDGKITQDVIDYIRDNVGTRIIDNSNDVDETEQRVYDEFIAKVKPYKIALSNEQLQEVRNKFDTYYNFKKQMAGKLTLNKNGIALDDIWTSICADSDGHLSTGETTNNQPIALAEYINKLQPKVRILNESDYDNATLDVAMEVFREYFEETAQKDNAQRIKDAVSARSKKMREQYQERYNKALKDVERQKALELDRLMSEIEELSEEHKKMLEDMADEDVKLKAEERVQAARNQRDTAIASVEAESRAKVQLARDQRDRAIENILNDRRERFKQLKEQSDEKIAKVKADYANKKLNDKEKLQRRELNQRLRKEIESLQNMVAHPQKGASKHIPADLVGATIDLLEAINMDTGTNKAVTERLRKLADIYARTKQNLNSNNQKAQSQYILDYDERIAADIEEVKNIFEGGKFYTDLYIPEIQRILDIVKALKTQIRNANNLILDGKLEDARRIAKGAMQEITDSRKGKSGFTNLLDRYSSAHLNAYREFRKLSGYTDGNLMKLYDDFEAASLTEMKLQREFGEIFSDVLEGKENQKEIKRFISTDEKDLVDIGIIGNDGKPIKVSRAMRMSIILHSQNESNMTHILYGGMRIPDMNTYAKNKSRAYENNEREYRFIDYTKYVEALANNDQRLAGEIVEKARNTVNSLKDDLGEWEQRFLKDAEELFHNRTGKYLNDMSMQLNGYAVARVKNYFPIKTDPTSVGNDYAGLKMDSTLEGKGNLKERVWSSKPIMLEDVTDVIQRTVRLVSQQVAYTIPVRNFNMAFRQNFNSSDGHQYNLEKRIDSVWGNHNNQWLKNFIADVQGARQSEGNIRWLNQLRGNFAGAVLSTNLSVAIKQAASFPTAAAVVGYKSLGKAVGSSFKGFILQRGIEELEEINPLLWYRNQGYGTQDIADAKNSSLIKSLPPAVQKALGWTQFMDSGTVRTLEYAARNYVDANYKTLEKGSKAYWNKVSEVFTQIVTETQPNYDTLHKADIIRNPNSMVKMLVMFKTQPMQNFGIIYDAIGELHANSVRYNQDKSEANKEALRESTKKFINSITSQFLSALVFSAMSILADLALHRIKKYKDDDDEMSGLKLGVALGNGAMSAFSGMALGGSILYSTIQYAINGTVAKRSDNKVLKQWASNGAYFDGISVSSLEAVEDFVKNTTTLANNTTKISEAKTTAEKNEAIQKTVHSIKVVSGNLGQIFGIPVSNIENIAGSIYLYIIGAVDQSDPTVWDTPSQYELMYNALINNDVDEYQRLLDEIHRAYPDKEDSSITTSIRNVIKAEYLDEDITREQAYALMSAIGDEPNKINININKWDTGTTTDYGNLDNLIDTAMDDTIASNRTAVVSEVEKLLSYGKTKSGIKSHLKSAYKGYYKSNYNTNKAADINAVLRQALMTAGYTDEEAKAELKKWLE